MRAIVLDNIDSQCKAILSQSGIKTTQLGKVSNEELLDYVKDVEIILVRSQTTITSEVIEHATNLRLIGRAGAGIDNIDLGYATKRGIIVMNTPGGNTVSAAEHTCAMILATARNIPQAYTETIAGVWNRKRWMGSELDGKLLSVIGFGKIGQEVAKRMKAFGMKILAYDPMVPQEFAHRMGVSLGSLEQCFMEADFITLHTPLNDTTKNLVSTKTIKIMKDGVRIVNCARGEIINEDDLAEALEEGKVASAALDVFSREPLNQESALARAPNFIATPHIAASTFEAQTKVASQIAHQIVDWTKGREVRGIVNAAALGLVQNTELQSYLDLSEKIGMFLAQYADGKATKITVITSGTILGKFSEYVSASAVKGILKISINETVLHNKALEIARDQEGMNVEVVHEKAHQDYTDLLRVLYQTDKGERLVLGGIVIGDHAKRIVMMNEFTCEVKPEKILLVYTNNDKPGVIARVGARLLRLNKNIANISLSRNDAKTQALTIISLDNDVDNHVLKKVAEVEGVFHPRIIRL